MRVRKLRQSNTLLKPSANSRPSRSQPRKKFSNCLAGQGSQARQQTRAFQKFFELWLRKVVTTTAEIACFPTCTGNSSKLKVRQSVVVGQPLALHTSSAASYTRQTWLRKVVTKTLKWLDFLLVQANQAQSLFGIQMKPDER